MMEILTKLIIIIAISAIYVQGEISSTKIKNNATNMALFYQRYMMESPNNTIPDIYRTQCAVIKFCCNDLSNQTFNILSNYMLEEKCIHHPEKILNRFKTDCSNQKKSLNTIKKSLEYGKFLKIQSEVPRSDERIRNWQLQMKKACNVEELRGYYCKSDDMELFQSCQEKMLQSLANENGEQNYDAFLQNWIYTFHTLSNKIREEIPEYI
ncbi:unnamed protein product [Adineta steineri]|uniref:Uncharacterized protein n=2 Tax=Adineta steineri TaxID=433720 RepID=A0A819NZK9_9BILA|nr:unnamed protein product [Adineta steineri]